MRVRIECKAVKGDVWATLSIKVEGNCKAFYLDTEIKSMDTEFVRRLDYRGNSGDRHTYHLNRSDLNRSGLTNNVLLKEYPEENIIVNCEG